MSVRGRRVVVTGADGFIGSHLVERLVAEGAEVRAFCFYNSRGSWGWLDQADASVRDAIDVKLGDVRDSGFVTAACADVEIVIHLAALIAIPYSYVAPESFVDTNVRGTLNVLEAARRHGVTRVIHTSTSEVYGTPASLPIRESHPMNAQSPYAATKVAADQLTLAFHRSYGVPTVILRPFNTYGPRQSTRAVLPTMIAQLLSGKREIGLGRLDTRRDMTYVADTVDAFIIAATKAGIEGETIQLGTGRSVTIEELFETVCSVVGVEAETFVDERRMRPDASEVEALESDPSRAREMLGWAAMTNLEEGIRKTVDWARSQPVEHDFLHI